MRLPKLAIENFQFTLVIFVLLTLTGVVSFFTMPRSEDPQVASPTANVVVLYPGTSPEDMERLVVDPIEEALNELDDIKKIVARAENDLAIVTVEFTFGEDPDDKYAEVVQKANSIRDDLPDEILSIDVNKFTISDFVNIFQIALVSDSIDYRQLDKEANYLKTRLEKVRGLKKVKIFAVPEQEIRISVDLQKIAGMRISLNEIIDAIQSNNANIPGGNIDLGAKRFNIQTSGPYQSLKEIRNTVIRSAAHHIVYLKDVAEVAYAFEEINYFARFNRRPAIFVTGTQKQGTNIFSIMDRVHREVAEHESSLPEGIELQWVFDQSQSVSRRLNSFFSNLLQGIILVGAIILLVLGARASVIIMIAIPISILIGIGFLDFSHFGIEQMSITGLVIALGLLVDNAIVVMENVSRFIKKGYGFKEAAIKGTSQISWAIVSSTATTVLAFLPIIFMQNISGDFIRSMPLTVVYTLAASLLISLTLTPFLASRFLKECTCENETRGQKLIGRFVSSFYRKRLDAALSHPKLTLSLAAFVFLVSLALFPLVGVSFFPKAEKPQFLIDVDLPKGASLKKTDEIAKMIENIIAEKAEVRHFSANIGKGNPVVYYNTMRRNQASNKAQFYVELRDGSMKEMPAFLESLRAEFTAIPSARIDVKEFAQGPPVEAPIAIRVIGEQLGVLKTIVQDVEEMIAATPGVVNIQNPLATPKTELHVKINREKAGMLGVSLLEVDRTVRMSMAGLAVAHYRDDTGDEFDIVLRPLIQENPLLGGAGMGARSAISARENRTHNEPGTTPPKPKVADLDKIYVTSRTGASVPLRQIATVAFKTSPSVVNHYGLDRAFTVTADVMSGVSIDKATKEIIAQLDAYDWPKGYRYAVGGELESREESFGGMLQAILVAMIAIFGVLVLQFRSFSQPLIVFTAIPLAIIGSIFTLLITGNNFSFTAFVGLTSLVGIVVNNSIILVDYTNQLRRSGMGALEALREAGQTRFMPIVLTTATTIGGLLPLTLQGGSMWAPMGWTIIGGLLVSAILTLLIVPVLYHLYTPENAFLPELQEQERLRTGGDLGDEALAM